MAQVNLTQLLMTLIHPAAHSIDINYTKSITERTENTVNFRDITRVNARAFDYVQIGSSIPATDVRVSISGTKGSDLETLLNTGTIAVGGNVGEEGAAGPVEFYLDSEVGSEFDYLSISATDIIGTEEANGWQANVILAKQAINISWTDFLDKAETYIGFINGEEIIGDIAKEGDVYSFTASIPCNYTNTDKDTTIVIYGINSEGRYVSTGSVTF